MSIIIKLNNILKESEQFKKYAEKAFSEIFNSEILFYFPVR